MDEHTKLLRHLTHGVRVDSILIGRYRLDLVLSSSSQGSIHLPPLSPDLHLPCTRTYYVSLGFKLLQWINITTATWKS
jgi:hypothetical protein